MFYIINNYVFIFGKDNNFIIYLFLDSNKLINIIIYIQDGNLVKKNQECHPHTTGFSLRENDQCPKICNLSLPNNADMVKIEPFV